jgi:hypothetical protein
MREPTDGKAGLEGIWKTEICIIEKTSWNKLNKRPTG